MIITNGQRNLTKGRIASAHGRFNPFASPAMPNFVAIGQSVTELSRVFGFQHGSCPPCWILKVGDLNGRKGDVDVQDIPAQAKRLFTSLTIYTRIILYKSSAVAEMGDRLATTDMGRKWGGAAVGAGYSLDPHLTQCGLGRGLTLY